MGSSLDERVSDGIYIFTPKCPAPCAQVSIGHRKNQREESRLVARAVEGLLVGILQGEGGGGTILPRLGAEVVVEAGAGGHGLRVEVRRERAILRKKRRSGSQYTNMPSSIPHTITASAATKPSVASRRSARLHRWSREAHGETHRSTLAPLVNAQNAADPSCIGMQTQRALGRLRRDCTRLRAEMASAECTDICWVPKPMPNTQLLLHHRPYTWPARVVLFPAPSFNTDRIHPNAPRC